MQFHAPNVSDTPPTTTDSLDLANLPFRSPARYSGLKRLLGAASIRRKIGTGYGLAIGIAILGTTTGLAIADHYQNKAQEQLARAITQEQLLNEMQRNVLHMRLHQHELITLLDKPQLFAEKHAHFLTHIEKLGNVIPELKRLADANQLKNLKQFLLTSTQTIEAYDREMRGLLNQVSPVQTVTISDGELQTREQKLLTFTTSETTLKFDGLLNDLIERIKSAQTSQIQAETTFKKAQALRVQIILVSMLLSVVLAIALAVYTSRAIARPLEAVTKVAQKATEESNFDLQAPVATTDEVGVLAISLNRLIHSVAAYTHDLEMARQTLEKRVEERTKELWQKNQELQAEREKSERLLLNILPEAIADRLKQEERSIADSFAAVTVLFADIVDFTQFTDQVSPTELVSLLNKIFSMFDELAQQHGLEKIKTIGDAYMVVGGLPQPRIDHAAAIANMALDMQQALIQFNAEHGENFHIRIGINTGPVVAGVIGTKKFIYDLWGDTVNIASRMESHGVADSIQVTTSTYQYLQDQFLLEERGTIQVKGKGEMTTYLLLGKKLEVLSS